MQDMWRYGGMVDEATTRGRNMSESLATTIGTIIVVVIIVVSVGTAKLAVNRVNKKAGIPNETGDWGVAAAIAVFVIISSLILVMIGSLVGDTLFTKR
jgi:hypothetical protein